jgi:hypothetical protein
MEPIGHQRITCVHLKRTSRVTLSKFEEHTCITTTLSDGLFRRTEAEESNSHDYTNNVSKL